MKQFTWTIFALVMLGSVPASGQICAYFDTDDYVTRLSGNSVRGHIGTSISGPCESIWLPGVEGELWIDWPDQFIAITSAHWGNTYGGSVEYTFSPTTLQTYGPGQYQMWGLHLGFCPAAYCGSDTYSPPYADDWDGWDVGVLDMERPAIDSTADGIGDAGGAAWWLGTGIADAPNGLYNQFLLEALKNCGSGTCTETPSWSVSQTGPTKITLDCTTSCSGLTNIATTQAGSASVGDITIKFSIGGFESEPFLFTVGEPKIRSNGAKQDRSAAVAIGAGWSGFETLIPYALYPQIDPYQNPMTVGANECFGGVDCKGLPWNPVTSNNWTPGPPVGGNVSTFYDQITRACVTLGCSLTPVPQSPSGSSTEIQNSPQTFRVGSTSAGVGLAVKTHTIHIYIDRGEH